MMGVRCLAIFLDFLDDFSACCLANMKFLGLKMVWLAGTTFRVSNCWASWVALMFLGRYKVALQ